MTSLLEHKTEQALEAIRTIHSDTSGPPADNLASIREIINEARMIEQMLEADCAAKEANG